FVVASPLSVRMDNRSRSLVPGGERGSHGTPWLPARHGVDLAPAFFLGAAACLAVALSTRFLATAFLATACLATAFLATAFLATAFLATFLAATCLAGTCLAAACLAAGRLPALAGPGAVTSPGACFFAGAAAFFLVDGRPFFGRASVISAATVSSGGPPAAWARPGLASSLPRRGGVAGVATD